jgi:hypothetical protein
VADRFQATHAIWSTAPSRSPWPDAIAAAEAFGSEPSHRTSNEWSVFLDPVTDGGVVLMRTGASTQVAVIERDRAVVVVRNSDDFVFDRVAGVAKVGGRWYVGVVPGPRAFQILAIDAGTLVPVGTFPRYADDAPARVVRSASGAALGIWVVGKGRQGTRGGGDTWFVYPVDTRSGEAKAPVVVSSDALSHTPAVCEPDTDGWVLVHDVNPSIARADFQNVTEVPTVGRMEARMVANEGGICLESLAAQVDGDPPRDLKARGAVTRSRRGAPLALTDRATDRRWGFRCAP